MCPDCEVTRDQAAAALSAVDAATALLEYSSAEMIGAATALATQAQVITDLQAKIATLEGRSG